MPEAPEKEAPTTSRLKTASTLVELLKNIALLVVLVYVCFQARAALKTVMSNVQNGKQSVTDFEVSDKTVKLKLTEVHDHLLDALNQAAATTNKGQPISPEAKSISAALNATDAALQSVAPASPPSPSEQWVYLGTQSAPNAAWRARNFNLTTPPQPGTSLHALTDVFRRNAKPKETPTPADPDNLDFGDVVGVLKQGETVTLSDVMQIHPKSGEVDWWGRIR